VKRLRLVSVMWAALPLLVGLCATVRAEVPPSDASSPPLTKTPAPTTPTPTPASLTPTPVPPTWSQTPRNVPLAPASVIAAAPLPAGPASSDRLSDKRLHDGFFVQLALGPVYLQESWSPTGGGAGATFGGWGTSLETSIGKGVRPGLIIGGRWQLVAVVDANESYEGTTYVAHDTARFLNVIAAFVDYYPNPRRGLHFGGTAGAVAASNLDAEYGAHATSWGVAISAHLGYEVFFTSRWSVGVLAQLSAYRYSTTEAGVSSVSDGLLPTLAVAFTFN